MTAPYYCWETPSPVGPLLLGGDGEALSLLRFQGGRRAARPPGHWRCERAPFAAVIAQLDEYFAGARREFDLELSLRGSGFQREVWQALRRIPYGTTRAYGELARELGHPGGARAVGVANGSNPVAIIVPCHRVIGADGSLTGFGGGLPVKRALLQLEGAACVHDLFSPPGGSAPGRGLHAAGS